MSTGWSIFVSVLVIGNLIGVMWLLFATSSKKGEEEGEAESTGHVWDGITELNHPLPRWWFNLFVGTTIFAFAYMFLFPGLGNFEGYLGWTQLNQLDEQIEQNNTVKSSFFAQFEGLSTEELKTNPEAMKTASRLFANNCAACHGSDAKGSKGFPSLADGSWLYGDSVTAVTHSIANGRKGMMPAFGSILSGQQIKEVGQYVLSLGGKSSDEAAASAGKSTFDMQCAACHGMGGEGNQMLGAPNLSDDAWLYGGLTRDIETTISIGRTGKMPAHASVLSEEEIELLAAYVLSL